MAADGSGHSGQVEPKLNILSPFLQVYRDMQRASDSVVVLVKEVANKGLDKVRGDHTTGLGWHSFFSALGF